MQDVCEAWTFGHDFGILYSDCEQSLTILQDSINTFLTKNDKEDERYKVIDEGSEADAGEAGDKDSDSTYQGSELEDISPANENIKKTLSSLNT